MDKVAVVINHNGIEYEAEMMVIESTRLGLQDHGLWDFNLDCRGGSLGCGVGGYCLDSRPVDSPFSDNERHGTAYGLDLIMQVCKTVGVDTWEELRGKRVYVLFDRGGGWGSQSLGIANIDTGDALILKEHAEKLEGK